MSDLIIKLKGVMPSEQVCLKIGEECGGKVVLAFSCGKDSIASWLQLRRLGIQVVPYYCYLVPGLKFIEDSLNYYEDFFQTKIHRLVSDALPRMLTDFVYQPPHNVGIIRASGIRKWKKNEFHDVVVKWQGMEEKGMIGVGVRACDSARRRLSFVMAGPINRNKRTFYPVWDWTAEKIRTELYKAKVRVPIDYWLFGRTFDGIDYRFVEPVSRHFPEDYERIKAMFPFVEMEILRRNSIMKGNTPCQTQP